MLIFTNPGLIDLDAVTTLGVSVKQPGSFGRFGTGLKFAVATILRGGGKVSLWRGFQQYEFRTLPREIRGKNFDLITLNLIAIDDSVAESYSLGITTMLGRDWEPWMVLREIGCNALDEGGQFGHVEDLSVELHDGFPVGVGPDSTTIIVEWDDIETAYRQRKELFLEGEALWESKELRILAGPSAHVFYRGVRVLKLEKPSLFRYDVLSEQRLTEDRTLAGSWNVDNLIRDAFLTMTEKPLIYQAVTSEEGYHEHRLNYEGAGIGVKPSKAFLDAAVEARQTRKLNNASAKKVLLRHIRDSAEESSTYGSYRRVIEDAFSYALEQLAHIGIKFNEAQKFIIVDELPGETLLSMVENGRLYVLRDLLSKTSREIAAELLTRWVDINVSGFDMDDVVKLLAPFVIQACPNFKFDEDLVKEDEANAQVEQPEAVVA